MKVALAVLWLCYAALVVMGCGRWKHSVRSSIPKSSDPYIRCENWVGDGWMYHHCGDSGHYEFVPTPAPTSAVYTNFDAWRDGWCWRVGGGVQQDCLPPPASDWNGPFVRPTPIPTPSAWDKAALCPANCDCWNFQSLAAGGVGWQEVCDDGGPGPMQGRRPAKMCTIDNTGESFVPRSDGLCHWEDAPHSRWDAPHPTATRDLQGGWMQQPAQPLDAECDEVIVCNQNCVVECAPPVAPEQQDWR